MPTSSDPLDSMPFLTADVPGVPGAIKRRYEDFRVDEIPAYSPCGHGDHVYFTIEKSGLATRQAVNDIARALGVAPRDIGLAGLKDARAVTRQMLSLEHADPQRIAGLTLPRIRVVEVARHTNKLKIGHLRGNRFVIRLRECDPGRLGDVRATMDTLARRGVPNYFGQQRFGQRGDTWQIGEALLINEPRAAIDLMCGRAGEHDVGAVRRARELFDQGDYDAAAREWPYMYRDNVRVCKAMARSNGDARRAIRAIDPHLQRFFVSAYQSRLFNRVLAARIERLDVMLPGDLAFKHENGAVFHCEDAATEQPRAARFKISPTGPLFGARMTEPTGEPGEIESNVRKQAGPAVEALGKPGFHRAPGGRRPLRFRPDDAGVDAGSDDAGPFIELRFGLPSGCYATAVLREICKLEIQEGREE